MKFFVKNVCVVFVNYMQAFFTVQYIHHIGTFCFLMNYIIVGLGSEECGLVWEEKKGRAWVRVRFVDCRLHREGWPMCVAVWVRVRVSVGV